LESLEHIVDPLIHREAERLGRQDIAIAVDDDARQAIRLGMDQPVEPAGIEPLAQGERRGKAARDKEALS
jgi:hypothetical protein